MPIKPKKGKCIDCPPEAPERFLCNKRCQYHYNIYLRQKKAAKQTVKRVAKRKPVDHEKVAWYTNKISQIPQRCENCGIAFGFVPPQYRSHLCAHIIPKSEVEGCAYHENNIIYLCPDYLNNCHYRWDNKGVENRKQMACYGIAVERVSIFYHTLNGHEQNRVADYLGKTDWNHLSKAV